MKRIRICMILAAFFLLGMGTAFAFKIDSSFQSKAQEETTSTSNTSDTATSTEVPQEDSSKSSFGNFSGFSSESRFTSKDFKFGQMTTQTSTSASPTDSQSSN